MDTRAICSRSLGVHDRLVDLDFFRVRLAARNSGRLRKMRNRGPRIDSPPSHFQHITSIVATGDKQRGGSEYPAVSPQGHLRRVVLLGQMAHAKRGDFDRISSARWAAPAKQPTSSMDPRASGTPANGQTTSS